MFPFLTHTFYLHPCPYKRTDDISVSPVHRQQFLVARPVFSGNFPRFSQCFAVKNAKKLSPVLSCSKIGRPSCFSPILLYGQGCIFFCRKNRNADLFDLMHFQIPRSYLVLQAPIFEAFVANGREYSYALQVPIRNILSF